MIDLTIIIVNHDTRELLAHCLESVEKACVENPELEVETLVVDNGSEDGSIGAALASGISPRIVALVRNRGFAAAVNIGLRLRRGRHVLLLNSDAEIEVNVLTDGVSLLDAWRDVGVLGVALFHPDGRPQRSVHMFPSLASEWLPEPIHSFLRRDSPRAVGSSPSDPHAGRLDDVDAVRGAVFFMRGELIEEVGAFDEGYFFFLEETDYCWRVRQAGFRVLHASALRAMHRLGASSKRRAPTATRIEYHTSLYRFLERRHGRSVRLLAQATRSIRTLASCIGLALLAAGSDAARSRLAERWGLFLWHLRGCPGQPHLGQMLSLGRATDADGLQIRVQRRNA